MKQNESKKSFKTVVSMLLFLLLSTQLSKTGVHAASLVEWQVKQTGATANAVTISYDAVDGASGYIIEKSEGNYLEAAPVEILRTTETTVTVPVEQNTSPTLTVVPLNQNGERAELLFTKNVRVYTIPSAPKNIRLSGSTFDASHKLEITWDENPYGGYEAVCYTAKGKKVDTVSYTTIGWAYAQFNKAKSNTVYKMRVRGVVTIDNQKLYSPYSKYVYVVPQPSAKVTKKAQKSVNIKWSKVNGAAEYQIYAKCNSDFAGKFKKVATVKKGKTSYKFTRLKGKKIDTYKNYYTIKVVAVGKFGSKRVKSNDNATLSVHLGL